jgi:DNA invertase Pin-like site-specific DNA recombinase
MFQMLGVFSQFERSMIQERVRAGLARARSEGKRLGRPKISPEIEAAIAAALGQGGSIRKTAKALGCSPGLVARIRCDGG